VTVTLSFQLAPLRVSRAKIEKPLNIFFYRTN
jgi:hypothetical protein